MTTRTQIHVTLARRYNRALVRFKFTVWPEQVEQMRTIRDNHMLEARKARGGEV